MKKGKNTLDICKLFFIYNTFSTLAAALVNQLIKRQLNQLMIDYIT